MKVLSSPDFPRKRTMRKVPKPLMEKRRRERINHSLETLRLLMLESTKNEKLRNPKVEKAEILESVVEFLKMETDVTPTKQNQNQTTYQDGMRSCLLRVSHFISSKTQDREEPAETELKAVLVAPQPDSHRSPPRHMHATLTPTGRNARPLVAPLMARHRRRVVFSHPYLSHCEGGTLLHHCTPAPTHLAEYVWRPWPQ